LRRLETSAAAPDFAEAQLAGVVKEFEDAALADGRVVERVRQEVLSRRGQAIAVRELVDSLRRRGLPLTFRLPADASDARADRGARELAALLGRGFGDEWNVDDALRFLRARFHERGLARAAAQRFDEARHEAHTALLIDPDFANARKLAARLDRRDSPARLSAEAARELADFQRSETAELRRRARFPLEQAERHERRDRTLRELLKAYRILLVAGGAAAADPEIAAFRDVARLRARERAGSRELEERLREVMDLTAERTAEVFRLAEELVELYAWELAWSGAPARAGPRSQGIDGQAAAAVIEEHRELAAEAARVRQGEHELESESALFKIERLRGWFPELGAALLAPSGARGERG
jgi:hypothetical protein